MREAQLLTLTTREGIKMKIGELAKIVGTNVETIRYYERIGLLENPNRTPSGYRNYTTDAVTQLRFIQNSQQLGFSLTEIKELVKKDINRELSDKINNLNNKLRELSQFKDNLVAMVSTEAETA